MKRAKRQSRVNRYLKSYNFAGIIVGALFVYSSFLPSLLPRGWVLQGLLSGILFCIGYGVGVFGSFIVREFKVSEPRDDSKSIIKQITFGVLGLLYVIALLMGLHWQKEVNQLVGIKPENSATVIGTTLVLVFSVLGIMLISRSIVTLFRWLKRQILRLIPVRLAYALATGVTVLVVIGLVNGVILQTATNVVNDAFGVKNGTTDAGVTQPKVTELSGGPGSLIAWDTLGRQGRNFVSRGQDTQAISDFNGAPAKQPVRVYSGLESAPSVEDRAKLAVDELQRTGGFNRKVLVVITTTGTGWVDEAGVNSLEERP